MSKSKKKFIRSIQKIVSESENANLPHHNIVETALKALPPPSLGRASFLIFQWTEEANLAEFSNIGEITGLIYKKKENNKLELKLETPSHTFLDLFPKYV